MLIHYRPQYQLGVRCSVGGFGPVDKSRGAGGAGGIESPSVPPCFKAVLMLHLKRSVFRKASVSL